MPLVSRPVWFWFNTLSGTKSTFHSLFHGNEMASYCKIISSESHPDIPTIKEVYFSFWKTSAYSNGILNFTELLSRSHSQEVPKIEALYENLLKKQWKPGEIWEIHYGIDYLDHDLAIYFCFKDKLTITKLLSDACKLPEDFFSEFFWEEARRFHFKIKYHRNGQDISGVFTSHNTPDINGFLKFLSKYESEKLKDIEAYHSKIEEEFVIYNIEYSFNFTKWKLENVVYFVLPRFWEISE